MSDDRITYLPVSLVAEMAYCPRNVYYRLVEQRDDLVTAAMLRGRREEARRQARTTRSREGATQHRSVTLSSERLGLIGVLDVVEERPAEERSAAETAGESSAETAGDGAVTFVPVEYKTGARPDPDAAPARFPEYGAPPEHVQVAAQAMLLEEALGEPVPMGVIYYGASRTRVEVPLTEALRRTVRRAIQGVRRLLDATAPPVPVADARCPGCAFLAHCQPSEQRRLQALAPEDGGALEAAGDGAAGEVPRVVPPDVPARTLFVDQQGARLRKRGKTLVVEHQDEEGQPQVTTRPLLSLEQVVLVGGVQLTTQAQRALLASGIDVVFLTMRGRFRGRLASAAAPHVHVRLRQYAVAHDAAQRLTLAKAFVRGKLHNQRVRLLRQHRRLDAAALQEAARTVQACLDRIEGAPDRATLRGLEGQAARAYFGVFDAMIRPDDVAFRFDRRDRRPPPDPVNALLGFAYALLTNDVAAACEAAGLDPHLGFYHAPRYGRPALALDLVEAFRPVIADSVVLTLLNRRMVRPDHFEEDLGGVRLTKAGRAAFFRAYAQRRAEEATHPTFGYRMPYHRHLLTEARLLAKVCTGDIATYPPFTIR